MTGVGLLSIAASVYTAQRSSGDTVSVTVCVGRAATVTTNQLKSKGGREGGGEREKREEGICIIRRSPGEI